MVGIYGKVGSFSNRDKKTTDSTGRHSPIFQELFSDTIDGRCAYIDGAPRWDDSELSRLAPENNPATILLHGYAKHGKNILQFMHGTFAIAITDPSENFVLLATDRMGTRPICYSQIQGVGLVFGSTTDAVLECNEVSHDIDLQAIYNYIYFHCIPAPTTIYSNIHKLEAAQCLIYKNDRLNISYYWTPTFSEDKKSGLEVLKHTLRESIQLSVKRCIDSHSSGCFLSGGLDSSTVLGMFSKASSTQVNAYSMGFSEDGYDEIMYARIAAKEFGADLHEYYVTPEDVNNAITNMVNAYDEPFGNSSAIPTYLCASTAYKDGTKTLLAGDGGDELFAGNKRYAQQKLFDLYWKLPIFLRKGVIEPTIFHLPFADKFFLTRKGKSYIDQARMPMPDRMESYNYLRRNPLETILAPDFYSAIDKEKPLNDLRVVYERAPSDSLLNKMLYLDWKLTLSDNDFRKVTRMCEMAGTKVRYPFADTDLVNFSCTVPTKLKLKRQRLRYFYKEAMKGFLPDEIINKPKHGFGLPFGEWLKTSKVLQDSVYERLEGIKKRDILLPRFIDTIINQHRSGHAAYYGTMVWVLAMLEEWFRSRNIKF